MIKIAKVGEKYRHKKRGTEYEIMHICSLRSKYGQLILDEDTLYLVNNFENNFTVLRESECKELERDITNYLCRTLFFSEFEIQKDPATSLRLNSKIVIYKGIGDNKLWGREINEFLDGRFERISDKEI